MSGTYAIDGSTWARRQEKERLALHKWAIQRQDRRAARMRRHAESKDVQRRVATLEQGQREAKLRRLKIQVAASVSGPLPAMGPEEFQEYARLRKKGIARVDALVMAIVWPLLDAGERK